MPSTNVGLNWAGLGAPWQPLGSNLLACIKNHLLLVAGSYFRAKSFFILCHGSSCNSGEQLFDRDPRSECNGQLCFDIPWFWLWLQLECSRAEQILHLRLSCSSAEIRAGCGQRWMAALPSRLQHSCVDQQMAQCCQPWATDNRNCSSPCTAPDGRPLKGKWNMLVLQWSFQLCLPCTWFALPFWETLSCCDT